MLHDCSIFLALKYTIIYKGQNVEKIPGVMEILRLVEDDITRAADSFLEQSDIATEELFDCE